MLPNKEQQGQNQSAIPGNKPVESNPTNPTDPAKKSTLKSVKNPLFSVASSDVSQKKQVLGPLKTVKSQIKQENNLADKVQSSAKKQEIVEKVEQKKQAKEESKQTEKPIDKVETQKSIPSEKTEDQVPKSISKQELIKAEQKDLKTEVRSPQQQLKASESSEGQIRPKKPTVKDLFGLKQPKKQQKPDQVSEPKQKIEEKLQPRSQEKPKVKPQEKVEIKQQIAKQTEYQPIANEQPFEQKAKQDTQKQKEEKVLAHTIEIKVTESTQKGSGLNKHIFYKIQGRDQLGSFHVLRRFSQFEAMRKLVRQRWPGCFIPALTNKSEISQTQQKQKDIRLILQNFLMGLSYSQHLYYKEEVQLFLRSPDIDIKEMIEQMPVLKTRDIISRFNTYFGEEFFQNKGNAALIKQFTTSLRKIANQLGTISKKALVFCEAYDLYSSSLIQFGEVVIAYERLCLSEYTNNSQGKLLVGKDSSSSSRLSALSEYSKVNPFYKLYNFLSNQARDAQSFLEIVIASELFALRKDELQHQIRELQKEIEEISLGHKTIKTMTSRKPKEEIKAELEAKQLKLKEQKQNMIEIFGMTETILSQLQIDIFKKFKRQKYMSILEEIGTVTASLIPQVQSMWTSLLAESKVLLK